MDIDPFNALPCPAAWRAHAFYDPTWRRSRDGARLDAASVRELLDGAQLPYAELRYMGVPAWLLGNALPHAEWVDGELATLLLGRIAWDATKGARGECWVDDYAQRRAARVYGAALVGRAFR